MTPGTDILTVIRNPQDYAAALDELDDLVLAEPGTPPGRRFDEIVRLIDEYEARRSGYILHPARRGQVLDFRTVNAGKTTTRANR
ncbi:MAG: hypothetical protein ABI624_10260 [Casimicrobiaceae bacterium]